METAKHTGKVAFEGGKYFLEAEGKREEMSTGFMVDEAQLKKLVGKEVQIIYGQPWVIAVKGPRIPCVVCYVPADPYADITVKFGAKMRVAMLKTFLEEGWISQEVFDKNVQGGGAERSVA